MLCFLCFVLLESSGGYAKTPNAFIFSLNNYETLAPFLSKVKQEHTGAAIDDRSYIGPKFGSDLIIYLDAESHASLGTYTLLQLQWTRPISWRGLEGIFHLMRWRYFIWTHPAKCKITRTEFNWKRSDSCNITQTSNQFLLSFSHFWELGNLRLSKGIFIETFTVNPLTLKTDLIVWICSEYWFTNSLP